MAAVGNLYWGKGNDEVVDKVSYPRYVSSLKCKQIMNRTGAILATTGIGAGIGAAAGAAAGGIGAGPGAAIGAGVGFGIAVSAASLYDYSEYKKYKASIKEDARVSLDEMINAYADQDCICPITGCVPLVPVRIHGEKQLYEKDALEETQRRQGCSPLTRSCFGMEDIEFAVDGVALTGKICDNILNNPQERVKFTSDQILGIKIYRKECLKVAQDYFEKESAELIRRCKNKEISPRDLARLTSKLADVLDPILSKEASITREMLEEKDDRFDS